MAFCGEHVGGIAAGIFGLELFGGLGGVTFMSQLVGTHCGCFYSPCRRLYRLPQSFIKCSTLD